MTSIYDLYGLNVRSELPLGARVVSRNGAAVDCEVLVGAPHAVSDQPPAGDVVRRREWNETQGFTVTQNEDGHTLRIHNICDFQISNDLRRVTAHVPDGEGQALVPLLVQCSLVAFLLDLAGEPTLHASAVQLGERVLAFAGHTNGGKSTLAALLCDQAGGRLVTDDLLRLELDGEVLRCVPGPPEIRLRDSADWVSGRFDASLRHISADRRTTVRTPEPCTGRPPLSAVVLPRPSREVQEPEITRLSQSQATYQLLGQLRTMPTTDRPDRLKRQFAWCTTLARQVPVYKARLPWGPPIPDEVCASLAELSGDR